ncbi:MAG: hypothetical protein K0S41_3915 [Anaerocolumna sp.]|jgi:hypothetical protein|nr:hypothetical protein [Anaerocolumna sp.]
MNCIDIQRLILPFINKKLDLNQLEEFTNHVNSCPNCMEELEVYYVLFEGMKQLDEDKELSNNFHEDLKNLIRESDDRILHDKFLHIRKRIILIILISIVAVISSFRFGEYVVEDVLQRDNAESNFLAEDIFIIDRSSIIGQSDLPGYNITLLNKINENLADIYVYLKIRDPKGAGMMEKRFGDLIFKNEKIPNKIGKLDIYPEWTILTY